MHAAAALPICAISFWCECNFVSERSCGTESARGNFSQKLGIYLSQLTAPRLPKERKKGKTKKIWKFFERFWSLEYACLLVFFFLLLLDSVER